jgi:hypothetical protein
VLELDAGVCGGEAPIDGTAEGVPLGLPGGDLAFEYLPLRDASVEALAGEDAQLDLGDVEPTSMFGGVVEFQRVGQAFRFVGWECFVQ